MFTHCLYSGVGKKPLARFGSLLLDIGSTLGSVFGIEESPDEIALAFVLATVTDGNISHTRSGYCWF